MKLLICCRKLWKKGPCFKSVCIAYETPRVLLSSSIDLFCTPLICIKLNLPKSIVKYSIIIFAFLVKEHW